MTSYSRILLLFLLVASFKLPAQTPAIDSLQKIIARGETDVETNKALNALATEYTRTDFNKARSFLYRSMAMAAEVKNLLVLSYAYSQMVTVQQNSGNRDSALFYLDILKQLSEKAGMKEVTSNFNFTAGLFYKKTGNFKEALPFMIKSLNNDVASDPEGKNTLTQTTIAGHCLNIGNVYSGLGDYRNALQYHLRSLKMFDKVGNQRGISFCYQSICSDFIDLNQFREALPYAGKALQLKTTLNDKRGVATAMLDYGTIYKGLGEYDKAVFYYQDGLQVFHEMKLLPDESKANLELGKTYMAKKDDKQAREYFDRARTLAIQIKDSSLINAVDIETSASLHKVAEEVQDEKNLLAKLNQSKKMGDKTEELSAYQYLADYYETNKQYDKALEYTRQLQNSRDSLQNGDLQLQFKKMEEQYNLDKKENEITLLKNEQLLNAEKNKRQENLQLGIILLLGMLLLIGVLLINRYRVVQKAKRTIEMERMRNNIARDLHDDIGSTLTSINILSKLVIRQQGNGPDSAASLEKINQYSGVIMDNMSDIVWAINPQNDSLSKVIVRIKTYASEILDPLNIQYEIKEEGNWQTVKFDLNHRKDFYLVCKEAINNAAKYSQCTTLNMSILQKPGGIQLKVEDNGIGFDARQNGKGNGLKNMETRAKSMGAEYVLETAPGKGCRISMLIPVT